MKRLAGTVQICGLAFKVWLCDAGGYPGFKADCYGRATYGECCPGTLEIWLNAEYPVAIRRETLSHEMLHGIWAHCSVNQILRKARKGTWHREELVINTISPFVRRAEASAERLKLK